MSGKGQGLSSTNFPWILCLEDSGDFPEEGNYEKKIVLKILQKNAVLAKRSK